MTKTKTPPMSPTVKQLIKGISSAYVRADMAMRTKDQDTELIHLLSAIHDCYVLIMAFYAGVQGIDKELALSYAKSGSNTAKRIEVLVEGGKER